METTAFKHTNEALAFMTLYKTMAPEIQKEVKDMIVLETEDEERDMFTALSFEAWNKEDEHLEEESAMWEKFYNEQKSV